MNSYLEMLADDVQGWLEVASELSTASIHAS
jgi:hypothetical protein